YVFVVIKPIKADTYHVTQSVEIATLQIKSEYRTTGPFSVERSRDVVKILPSMVDSSMQITVPNAADKVILLSIVSTDKEKALTQISEAVNLLKERHGRMISIMKDTKIINPTSALNEPKVVFIPFKNKLTKLMVFGVVMGGVFGLIISLLVRLIRAQREK
ncbi:MAG: hypothetical protein U9R28_04395, partial [Pseudomonadota bacterium]|nr:hypothetical protein [Pseudomonadota bacterium]